MDQKNTHLNRRLRLGQNSLASLEERKRWWIATHLLRDWKTKEQGRDCGRAAGRPQRQTGALLVEQSPATLFGSTALESSLRPVWKGLTRRGSRERSGPASTRIRQSEALRLEVWKRRMSSRASGDIEGDAPKMMDSSREPKRLI